VQGLTIVGAGLIGCSFALAARNAGLCNHFEAIEPDPVTAQRALELGLIDAIVSEPAVELPVLLSCPSHLVVPWLRQLAAHTPPIFDVASVKGAITQQLAGQTGPAGFVPCHPIAGRETSGPDAADPDLFQQRLVIITPTGNTDPAVAALVRGWWQAVGARVEEMDPQEHDRIYARTSHLPHLLAFAYLLGIEPTDLQHSGGGFRDFSRIGASDADMWSAIFNMNRQELKVALETFRGHLDEFIAAIDSGDMEACRRLIHKARSRRSTLER
jgi:prephenate dehydrogenase